MIVYVDESGDLGWKFDAPFLNGGSSRYLTIAYVICPIELQKSISRLVRKIYKKYNLNLNIEKKGANFSTQHSTYISQRILDLLNENESISISTVTVNKQNVFERIREDTNIIYNYALVLYLSQEIRNFQSAKIIPDKRTIRIVNGDTLDNYLRIKLHAELNSPIQLDYEARESTFDMHLWFIDWVANFVWRHFEKNDSAAYEILSNRINDHRLYF